jgi:hypothetical protein
MMHIKARHLTFASCRSCLPRGEWQAIYATIAAAAILSCMSSAAVALVANASTRYCLGKQ